MSLSITINQILNPAATQRIVAPKLVIILVVAKIAFYFARSRPATLETNELR